MTFNNNDNVTMNVNLDNRRACARSHSAGHLLDQAMKRAGKNMKGLKGYHFLAGSYVEFEGKIPAEDRAPLLEQLQKHMDELVMEDLLTNIKWVTTKEELDEACLPGAGCGAESRLSFGPVRVVQVGGKEGCPCGGTHVVRSSEVGKVTVTKIKVKKGVTKISYQVSH
jgi:Ser-tRNA(Ala) deacylase AlaX